MNNRQARKQVVLNSLLRREQWELEAIKSDNARGRRLLDRENRTLDEVNGNVEATNTEIRQLTKEDSALEIDVLQRINQHLVQLTREQVESEARHQHFQSEVDRIAAQLKRKLLYTRGLTDVEDITAGEIDTARQKQESRESEELWVQCNGKKK
ncbi:MAG: hypothetical protein GY815_02925 [Gammaproteobacteria bacterium]|nr:hypothetical protein [Gammaproteobacteria bacterium]